MSKGPGKIERAIAAVFAKEPDNAFTVEDLCERIYFADANEWEIEKKHRVAVLRAAASLGKRQSNLQHFKSEQLGRTTVFFLADNVLSYAMAQLKADKFRRYSNHDPRYWHDASEADLRKCLKPGGENHHLIVPKTGAWWRHVEMWKAERDGDHERLAKLRAEQDKALSRAVQGITGRWTRRTASTNRCRRAVQPAS